MAQKIFTNCSNIYQGSLKLFEAVFKPKLSVNHSERELKHIIMNFFVFISFCLKPWSIIFIDSVWSIMSPSADNTAIGPINSLFCRKKRIINKFFPIAGSRLSFSVKISRGELTRRINKLLSSVLFSCFVKANLNWIIHLLFRSTCRSLENLSLKLVWSYNFRAVFKMFQLLGHFFVCFACCLLAYVQPSTNRQGILFYWKQL